MCLLAEGFLLTLKRGWRKKMSRITRPQVYRAIAAVIDWRTVAHAAAVEDDDENYRRPASQRQKD